MLRFTEAVAVGGAGAVSAASAMAKKTGLTFSREFDSLIRAIGECKSKAEEDAIIAREVSCPSRHVFSTLGIG